MAKSLIDGSTKIKVSSTLDKSVGKKNLIDGSPETCWTSQQGLPQYVHITFELPVLVAAIHITFQGGFVGKKCTIGAIPFAGQDANSYRTLTTIYPEDVNRKQSFELPDVGGIRQLNLVFSESSDFFGRITIYDLQVEGQPATEDLPNDDGRS